jgi:effector-binding domain-containing protein
MAHTVRLAHRAGTALAVIRRQARPPELSRLVPDLCGRVWNALKAQHTKGGRHVAVYWDGTIKLEVGVELLGAFTDTDGVVHSATPAGLVASTMHFGPYAGLAAAHDAVRRWCEARAQTLAGPSWEIYGHWAPEWNADPSRIETEVCWLVSSPD